LHHLLGLRLVAQHGSNSAEYALPDGANELGERILIASSACLEQSVRPVKETIASVIGNPSG
jgi:hypothetical protein